MSSLRYPVPPRPPRYVHPPNKVRARGGFPLFQLVAAVFVLLALGLAFWLAAILLAYALRGNVAGIGYLLLFWAVTAYLALPRVHQIFTLLYLPDYFIGRTRTDDGLLGDAINLGLDGSERDVHVVMTEAGWVRADELDLHSAWQMVVSAVLRRSYPSAPVSGLHLFGRRHDFAYQQEVDGNPSQRHHVRFWRVPQDWLLPGGYETQWLAAGSYDRSVGFSIFTGQITHKIDANIDIERDYIVDTVRYVDPGSQVHVIKDFSTSYHSRNGGGDRIITDGDLPILDVTGAAERLGQGVSTGSTAARKQFTQHAVPPPSLLIGGALVAARAVLTLTAWIYERMGGHEPTVLGTNLNQLGVTGLQDLAAILLWWFIVARKRVAWVALMALAVVDAFGQLMAAGRPENAGFSSMLAAGIAVLTVLTVTASSVRDWVSRGRVDPQVQIPDATWRPHLPGH
ncbi:LssY C-terminal domain-containing protein [Luteococcus peritonei]|uniref:LssY C-terminal domain-containing protein n=1 Tax=Luteococcus peritonei TaxID=88874 RepID=A0ABW4RTS0_9ACTN